MLNNKEVATVIERIERQRISFPAATLKLLVPVLRKYLAQAEAIKDLSDRLADEILENSITVEAEVAIDVPDGYQEVTDEYDPQ